MTGTNGFLPWATGVGANVLDDPSYAASDALPQGAQRGRLPSPLYNKINRQTSVIASMIGQFIVSRANVDANDSQSITTIKTNFETALAAYIASVVAGLSGAPTPFALTGSGNLVVPAGYTSMYVQGVGAGGGGAQNANAFGGGGGGAGGFASGLYPVTGGQSLAYSCGVGGLAGAGSTIPGGTGGPTYLAALFTCLGGVGGTQNGSNNAQGGAGGTASGGNILNEPGGDGGDGNFTANSIPGGHGGASFYGGGGRTGTNVGATGRVHGAGGGGGWGPATAPGGAGANGLIMGWFYR